MKTRILGGITGALVVTAVLAAMAVAAPQISIYTDKASYQAGDAIEVSLAGGNHGEATSVDVYIGLLTPDGALYTRGELAWSEGIGPWIENIHVPSGFSMDRTPFFRFDLPCEMPPIDQPGEYSYAAGLTHPGTLEFTSNLSSASFQIIESPTRHYYVNGIRGSDWRDGSEEFPWETITHALDCIDSYVTSPVTVYVSGGVYSSSVNGEAFPVNMKSWISLIGEGPEQSAVLDAEENAFHVIYCENVRDSIIEGFTITGGASNQGSWNPDGYGGGIYCTNSTITIRNNRIMLNFAECGGAIFIDACSGVIANNTLVNNQASTGGAIAAIDGLITISNNTISGNSANHGAGGGGIYCWLGSPIITDNIISDNVAFAANWDTGGGGIMCGDADATISGNLISHNSVLRCGEGGGGVLCHGGACEISNNVILGNYAESGRMTEGHGGGVCCYGTSSTIFNNIISDNEAYVFGGAVACGGEVLIRANTIVGNSATLVDGVGGLLESCFEGRPILLDCIIWDNGDEIYNCDATYSCIEEYVSGEGNIRENPMFVTGPLGDYYLDPDSPCIDAGSRSAEEAGLSGMTTQTDGTPDTGTVDMGYHHPLMFVERPPSRKKGHQ